MGYMPEVSTLGQCDSFRLMLVTGWKFHLQFIRLTQCLCHCWQCFWNDAIQHSLWFSLNFMIPLNYCFLNLFSIFGKKMWHGARSGEWRGRRTTTMWFAVENYGTDKFTWASMLLAVLKMPVVWPFSPCILCLLPCEILYRTVESQFGLEEQTLYEEFPHCQIKQSTWCQSLNWSAPPRPAPPCFALPSVLVVEMGSSTGKTAALYLNHFHKSRFRLLSWSYKGSSCHC